MSPIGLRRLVAAAEVLLKTSDESSRFPGSRHSDPQFAALMNEIAVFSRAVHDAKPNRHMPKMKKAKDHRTDTIIASLELELAKANNKLNVKESETAELTTKLAQAREKLSEAAEAEAECRANSKRLADDLLETAGLAGAIERRRVEEGKKQKFEVEALGAQNDELLTSLGQVQDDAGKKQKLMAKLLADMQASPRPPTCVVCMDKESTRAYLACGHLALCDACCLSSKECAICRQTDMDNVRIFLS